MPAAKGTVFRARNACPQRDIGIERGCQQLAEGRAEHGRGEHRGEGGPGGKLDVDPCAQEQMLGDRQGIG